MARTADSHYHQLRAARLKELAKQRGLPAGGSKNGLIGRLLRYDDQHPFPFLKLPSELQDMIYRLIISDSTQFAKFGKQLSRGYYSCCPHPQNFRHFRPEERNRLMVQQPSMFATCKTIRAEGLPLFVRLREFHFVVTEGILTLKMLLRWIGALDSIERSNIRSVTVLFFEKFDMKWILFVNELIELLPPKARVSFEVAFNHDIQKLKSIEAAWKVLKPKARKPRFWGVSRSAGTPTSTAQVFESEGSIWPSAARLTFKDKT